VYWSIRHFLGKSRKIFNVMRGGHLNGVFRMGKIETPYSVREVSKLLGISPQLVAERFATERGVIIIEREKHGKRGYRTLRIPRHVFRRVVEKWTVR
jgi:hypothetical protein